MVNHLVTAGGIRHAFAGAANHECGKSVRTATVAADLPLSFCANAYTIALARPLLFSNRRSALIYIYSTLCKPALPLECLLGIWLTSAECKILVPFEMRESQRIIFVRDNGDVCVELSASQAP